MASHHQQSADILPFGRSTDAPGPRFVRPIPEERIARVLGEPVDLYATLIKQQRPSWFTRLLRRVSAGLNA